MEETLVSPKMGGNDLLKNLRIIILKGFSSSSDLSNWNKFRKKVIEFNFIPAKFKLYKEPLTGNKNNFLKINKNPVFFLNQKTRFK